VLLVSGVAGTLSVAAALFAGAWWGLRSMYDLDHHGAVFLVAGVR
jgi:hypothetical protein